MENSDEAMAEVMRKAEEIHINMWSSVVDLCQCMKAWKERHNERDAETNHLLDGQLQTHHTRDDEPGLFH